MYHLLLHNTLLIYRQLLPGFSLVSSRWPRPPIHVLSLTLLSPQTQHTTQTLSYFLNSMERQDPARMSQDNMYPPPDSTNTGTSPFYMHHQHVTLGVHPQISHAPTAMMHHAPQGPSKNAIVDYRHHSQHSTPQQLAQQGLVVNTTDNGPPSNKKAKASRACDECRRKKVSSFFSRRQTCYID